MILYENDFLKTYNEIDSLWEDVDTFSDQGVSATNTRQTEFEFQEIVRKALACAEQLSAAKRMTAKAVESGNIALAPEDVSYWCDLRYLVEHKSYSLGRVKSKHWYTRVLSFYRAYLAEHAIRSTLARMTEFGGIVNFRNKDDQRKLRPDMSKADPDIEVPSIQIDSKNLQIECKAYGVPVTTHGAHMVARHSVVDWTDETADNDTTLNLKVCLVAHPEVVEQIYGTALPPKYVKVLDKSIKLEAGFHNLPDGAFETNPITIPAKLPVALKKIDSYLNKHPGAKADKAAYVVDQQADALDNTLKQLGGSPPSKDPIDQSTNPTQAAAQNLKRSALSLTDFMLDM